MIAYWIANYSTTVHLSVRTIANPHVIGSAQNTKRCSTATKRPSYLPIGIYIDRNASPADIAAFAELKRRNCVDQLKSPRNLCSSRGYDVDKALRVDRCSNLEAFLLPLLLGIGDGVCLLQFVSVWTNKFFEPVTATIKIGLQSVATRPACLGDPYFKRTAVICYANCMIAATLLATKLLERFLAAQEFQPRDAFYGIL